MLGAVVRKARERLRLRPGRDHEEVGGVVVQTRGGQGVPDALGHEGHHGMKEAHRDVEDVDEVALHLQFLLRRPVEETTLAELDVPVADLVPEERLETAGVVAEVVGLQLVRRLGDDAGKAAEHPGVLGRLGLGRTRHVSLEVHLDEATRVPDLGHERAGLLGARAVNELVGLLVDVRVELDVLVRGDEREEVEAHGVRAVLPHEGHRVNAVALGLAHATAVLGEDGRIDVHVVEGDLVDAVERAHDHASDP